MVMMMIMEGRRAMMAAAGDAAVSGRILITLLFSFHFV